MGLEEEEDSSGSEDPEISSIAPCVGLCHVERVQVISFFEDFLQNFN